MQKEGELSRLIAVGQHYLLTHPTPWVAHPSSNQCNKCPKIQEVQLRGFSDGIQTCSCCRNCTSKGCLSKWNIDLVGKFWEGFICLVLHRAENHSMIWGLKDHLVQGLPPWTGTLPTKPGYSKPHPAWAWTLPGGGASTASLGTLLLSQYEFPPHN